MKMARRSVGTWRPSGWGVWEKMAGRRLCQVISTSLGVPEARSATKLALTLPEGIDEGLLGSPGSLLGQLRWIERKDGAGSVAVIRWAEHASHLPELRQPVVDALLVALAAGEAAAAVCASERGEAAVA